jgi:hypothetical protein
MKLLPVSTFLICLGLDMMYALYAWFIIRNKSITVKNLIKAVHQARGLVDHGQRRLAPDQGPAGCSLG